MTGGTGDGSNVDDDDGESAGAIGDGVGELLGCVIRRFLGVDFLKLESKRTFTIIF